MFVNVAFYIAHCELIHSYLRENYSTGLPGNLTSLLRSARMTAGTMPVIAAV